MTSTVKARATNVGAPESCVPEAWLGRFRAGAHSW
jgi:hypothetical protein